MCQAPVRRLELRGAICVSPRDLSLLHDLFIGASTGVAEKLGTIKGGVLESRIRWAGAGTATDASGSMDGAISAAKRAADEVLD